MLALLAGPLLARLGNKQRALLAVLDGFVVVALIGLLALHVVPHAVEQAGVWALLAAALGLLLPVLLERRLSGAEDDTSMHGAMVWLAAAGLAVHAMLDGAALIGETGEHGHDPHAELLALGVILHRLPLGLTIWWAVRPTHGMRSALAIVGLVAVATVTGYFGAESLLASLPVAALAAFQALVAGSLLHLVVGHAPHGLQKLPTAGRWSSLGALLGGATVIGLVESHPAAPQSGVLSTKEMFTTLTLQTAPWLLLALGCAALLRCLLGPSGARVRQRWARAGRGLIDSLSLPPAAGGLAAARLRLQQHGGSKIALVLTVMGATLSLDALLLTIPLLGTELLLLRVVFGLLVSLAVGIAVARQAPFEEAEHVEPPPQAVDAAPNSLSRYWAAVAELVDRAGLWLVLGLLFASIVEPLIAPGALAATPLLAALVLLVLGVPAYLSAAALTPLMAVLLHKGLTAGAAMTFLLVGPAMSLAALFELRRRGRTSLAIGYGVVVVAVAVGAGWLLNRQLPTPTRIDLHALAQAPPTVLQLVSIALLAIAMLVALFRRGPRGLLGQVFAVAQQHDGHDHHHEDDDQDG